MIYGMIQICKWDHHRKQNIPLEKKPLKFYPSKTVEDHTTSKLELIAKMSYLARKKEMEKTYLIEYPLGFYL